jgi:hypothetical protein
VVSTDLTFASSVGEDGGPAITPEFMPESFFESSSPTP